MLKAIKTQYNLYKHVVKTPFFKFLSKAVDTA